MRSININGSRLMRMSSHHNLAHWFLVIIIRTLRLLAFSLLGIYLALAGYWLSRAIIQPYLPLLWEYQINLLSLNLPYFPVIRSLIIGLIGPWQAKAAMWWTLVIGGPLIFAGLSMVFLNSINLLSAILSPNYNQTHCPFCKDPIMVTNKLRSTKKKG